MNEPAESGGPADARKAPLRWYQFRLRTLLIFMTLIVGLLVAWRELAEPYRQQRETMKLVKDLGGEFQTAEAASWQRAIFGADFQNVTMVSLPDCDDPAKYLPRVAALPRLEALAVGGLKVTDEHLRNLRRCNTLRVLVLDSTSVSSDELATWQPEHPQTYVFRSQRRAIEAILEDGVGSLIGQRAGLESPAEVEKWFGNRFFRRAVSLSSPGVNNDALAYVAVLSDLESVDLSDTAVGDGALIHVRGLDRLKTLDLSHTRISDEGLAHVGVLRPKMLYLSGTGIGDAGVAHLMNLTNLVRPDLDGTLITNAALKHLRALPNLAVLYLDSTRITEAGLTELRSFPGLRAIFLRQNGISLTAKSQLQAALPECFICIE